MKTINEHMNKDLSHYIESLQCRKVNIETDLTTFEPMSIKLKLEELEQLQLSKELETINIMIQDLKGIECHSEKSYWEYYPR